MYTSQLCVTLAARDKTSAGSKLMPLDCYMTQKISLSAVIDPSTRKCDEPVTRCLDGVKCVRQMLCIHPPQNLVVHPLF